MINFSLMVFLVFELRKILWLMIPPIMNNIEEKLCIALYSTVEFLYFFVYLVKGILKLIIHTAIGFVMFMVDISTPTRTETVFLEYYRNSARKIVEERKDAFEKTEFVKQTKQVFSLLEFDTFDNSQTADEGSKVA